MSIVKNIISESDEKYQKRLEEIAKMSEADAMKLLVEIMKDLNNLTKVSLFYTDLETSGVSSETCARLQRDFPEITNINDLILVMNKRIHYLQFINDTLVVISALENQNSKLQSMIKHTFLP